VGTMHSAGFNTAGRNMLEGESKGGEKTVIKKGEPARKKGFQGGGIVAIEEQTNCGANRGRK